jgi:prenyltransferase beta subunit
MRQRIIYFIFLVAVIISVAIENSFAQLQQFTSGLTYLTTSQNPDGSWGSEAADAGILPSTIAAIEALKVSNQASTQTYSNAISWIQTQGLQTTDYFSERMHALMVAGADRDVLLSYLDEIIGAWGGYSEFEVNTLDTALALQALKTVNYQDQDTISNALGYLISTQNTDGGWGFCDASSLSCGDGAGDSTVYMTAIVLQTLSQFMTTYNLQASIIDAAACLLSHQNPDGGFGSSP